MSDAYRNETVAALLTNPEALAAGLHASILAVEVGENEAFDARERWQMMLKPKFDWISVTEGKQKRGRKGKPIRCIETDLIYESAAEAARELQIFQSNLSSHLNSGKPATVGGYSFEYYKEEQ